jgi:hypothetical protein
VSNFGNNITAWAENAKVGVDQVIRASVLDISGRITKRTPVGNPSLWESPAPKGYVGGAARGNWNASIGVIDETKNPSNREGGPTAKKLADAVNRASGNKLYFTNSVPYIFRLEYQQWSTQAPAGMVRVSVLEFNQALKKAIAGI